MAASVTKADQKKQKDILRKYTLQIFLLKYNDAKKQNLMKVFFDYEILSFWSYEKLSWKNVVCVYFI